MFGSILGFPFFWEATIYTIDKYEGFDSIFQGSGLGFFKA